MKLTYLRSVWSIGNFDGDFENESFHVRWNSFLRNYFHELRESVKSASILSEPTGLVRVVLLTHFIFFRASV